MFTTLRHPAFRLLPAVPLFSWLRLTRKTHQNRLDPQEMTESLKRDLGLIDGRTPRGAPPRDDGARTVMRLIRSQPGF
jgi:hypothetical protein